MRLTDRYIGRDNPFEGDQTVWLRGLPAGAQVTGATITLTPVARRSGRLFEETITFTGDQGDQGATLTPATAGTFVEVDFHARRTLASVQGAQGAALMGAGLKVDMGGAFVDIADDGTFMAPGKTALTIVLSEDTPASLPGLTVNKFRLSGVPQSEPSGNDATLGVTQVVIRSTPANVSVRLGQMPPFWTRLGELVAAESSPDFAAVLRAFLATATAADGFYAIPFGIHSDALARLDAEVRIDYVLDQPVLPPYLPEITLPYGFSTQPGVDLSPTTVQLPRGAMPLTAGARIQGEFQPSRIAMGSIGAESMPFMVEVSPICALAQPLRSSDEIALTGVDLPLGKGNPALARLHLAIQDDNDGKPSGTVRTSAEVIIDKPLPDQSVWGSATLSEPFRVVPGERYWLVLQSEDGQANWSAAPRAGDEPALQCSRDGGLSWRIANASNTPAPLAALFRLRHVPLQFSVPVQLQVGGGPGAVRHTLHKYAPLGRIEFGFDFAPALAVYMAGLTTAAPCGSGELLVNGGFDQPPCDDAAQRLFGFESGRAFSPDTSAPAILAGVVQLDAGVDLSVERFITLSINGGAPLRIDCAGANPARTLPDEVVRAINRAFGRDVAEFHGRQRVDGSLRVASPTLGSGSVELHDWAGFQAPTGWRGQPGHIVRLRRAGHVFALLAAPPALLDDLELAPADLDAAPVVADTRGASELAQRVPVAGGCGYLLRLLYVAEAQDDGEDRFSLSRWRVDWRDAAGHTLATEEGALTGPSGRPITGEGGLLESSDPADQLSIFEATLLAPEGAVAADLRFVQQPGGLLALEDVSLRPTLQALTNSSFRAWNSAEDSGRALGQTPLGWTVASGVVVRLAGGALLAGSQSSGAPLSADSVLTQTVAVRTGERYELRVLATPALPPAADPAALPADRRARLELRWLADGPLGAAILVPLDGRDFTRHAWAGVAPSGALHAEVRLVQPRGLGALLVESIALERVDMVSVPLIFLAEAPGDLTVADLRVAYDLPAAPEELPIPAALAAREPFAVRELPPAGIIAPADATPSPAGIVAPADLALPRPSPLADRPIAIINGVGPAFAAALHGLPAPIATIAELAALDPAVAITGVPLDRRLNLKATAELLIGLDLDAAPFAATGPQPLEELLALSPAELAQRAGQPVERAERLQRDVRALRLLLKNGAFHELRLRDLAGGWP